MMNRLTYQDEIVKMLELTAKRRQLAAQLKAVKEAEAEQGELILTLMLGNQLKPPFKVDTGQLSGTLQARKSSYFGSVNSDWMALKSALDAVGWSDLVRPQTKALTSRLLEYEENQRPIPDLVLNNVSRVDKRKITVVQLKVGGISIAEVQSNNDSD